MKKTGAVLLAAALLGAVVLFGAFGAAALSSGNQNPDGSWVLDSNSNISLIINGTSVSGNSGINQYFGSFVPANGQLTFNPLGSTMMAGPADAMKAEQEFLSALQSAAGYKLTDGKLVFTGADGKTLLTFVKAPAAVPSPDGNWVLDTNSNISLAIDGTSVSGNSGVNQYFGSIAVDNGNVTFSPLGSTMMAGPADAMKAEQEFLSALQSAAGYKLTDGKLVFTGADGKTLLTFVQA
ncbi:MAG: META domain-containing protein [Methanocorpusculum sp.]|nr:META domain-containing protein [Methanocorpusculum sp.]